MKGRDHQGLTNMSEDIDTRLSEEQKAAVRRLCGAQAVGEDLGAQVADATEMMMMLGVHPRQPADDEYLTGYPAMPQSSAASTPRRLSSL